MDEAEVAAANSSAYAGDDLRRAEEGDESRAFASPSGDFGISYGVGEEDLGDRDVEHRRPADFAQGGVSRDSMRQAERVQRRQADRIVELETACRTLRGQLKALGRELASTRNKSRDALAAKAKLSAEVRHLQESIEVLKSGPTVKSDIDYQREADSMRAQMLGLRKEVVQLIAKIGAKDERIGELEGNMARAAEGGGGTTLTEREHHEQIIRVASDLTAARDSETRARAEMETLRQQLLNAERRCTLLEDQVSLAEEALDQSKAEVVELAGALRDSELLRVKETSALQRQLDLALEDLATAQARLVTSEENNDIANRKIKRNAEEFRKEISKFPARQEAMRQEKANREEAERRSESFRQQAEKLSLKVAAMEEEIAESRSLLGELESSKAIAARANDTIEELKRSLAVERQRGDKLARSHGRAADIKMKEHERRRQSDKQARSLNQRIAYMEHKATAESAARRAAEEREKAANVEVRELKRSIQKIYAATGKRGGPSQLPSRSSRPTSAHGSRSSTRQRPASAATVMQGSRRGTSRLGGNESSLFGGSQAFDKTFDSAIVEGDEDDYILDHSDEDRPVQDPDYAVRPGGFQIVNVGVEGLLDSTVAILPPQGDQAANKALKMSGVNSWLRRFVRKFPSHRAEQAEMLRSIALMFAQLIWQRRVVEARRMTSEEKLLDERGALASKLEETSLKADSLSEKLADELAAKRKVLLQYLSAVLHAAVMVPIFEEAARAAGKPIETESTMPGTPGGETAASSTYTDSPAVAPSPTHADDFGVDLDGLADAAARLGADLDKSIADARAGGEDSVSGASEDAAKQLEAEAAAVGRAAWDALRFTRSPLQLHLSGCGLGDEEARALVAALRGSPGVRQLDLRSNSLTDAGARALGLMINLSTNLQRIDLRGNSLTEKGLQDLAEATGALPGVSHVVVSPAGKIEGLGEDPAKRDAGSTPDAADAVDAAELVPIVVIDARHQHSGKIDRPTRSSAAASRASQARPTSAPPGRRRGPQSRTSSGKIAARVPRAERTSARPGAKRPSSAAPVRTKTAENRDRSRGQFVTHSASTPQFDFRGSKIAQGATPGRPNKASARPKSATPSRHRRNDPPTSPLQSPPQRSKMGRPMSAAGARLAPGGVRRR